MTLPDLALIGEDAFRRAAWDQRFCQAPDCQNKAANWHPHHVIYEQHLRKLGLEKYHAHNAMRLCRHCHSGQHTIRKIPLTALSGENVAYAFTVMGAKAYDYLRRYYDGEDPRVDRGLEACERNK